MMICAICSILNLRLLPNTGQTFWMVFLFNRRPWTQSPNVES